MRVDTLQTVEMKDKFVLGTKMFCLVAVYFYIGVMYYCLIGA